MKRNLWGDVMKLGNKWTAILYPIDACHMMPSRFPDDFLDHMRIAIVGDLRSFGALLIHPN